MSENKNIILCGVGGQGTVLASKLLAAAAMEKDIPVMSAETIGMAQRGGSVFSHLRMGDALHAPMIAKKSADIIIGFEPGETVRMLPYLKEGGYVVTGSREVVPVTASVGLSSYSGEDMVSYLKETVDNLVLINTDEACEKIGSSKVANMVLLGAALSTGVLDVTVEDIAAVMKKRVKERFIAMNEQALEYGVKAAANCK